MLRILNKFQIFWATNNSDSNFFQFIDSDLQSPLDNIKNLNLFDGGSATVKHGFQIKTEDQKKDLRPIELQLGIDTNEVLSTNSQLKREMINLIKSYPNIWAFYGQNK